MCTMRAGIEQNNIFASKGIGRHGRTAECFKMNTSRTTLLQREVCKNSTGIVISSWACRLLAAALFMTFTGYSEVHLSSRCPYSFLGVRHSHWQVEAKGRTNTNLQDERHACDRRGVRSKCHMCENIMCGEDLDSECSYQLQGVSYPVILVRFS